MLSSECSSTATVSWELDLFGDGGDGGGGSLSSTASSVCQRIIIIIIILQVIFCKTLPPASTGCCVCPASIQCNVCSAAPYAIQSPMQMTALLNPPAADAVQQDNIIVVLILIVRILIRVVVEVVLAADGRCILVYDRNVFLRRRARAVQPASGNC
jgi:hypothetical protein